MGGWVRENLESMVGTERSVIQMTDSPPKV